MGEIFYRPYGAEATISFDLYKLDGTGLKTDAASATGDITVIKDEAAETGLTADAFTNEGSSYSLVLSATEMECKHIRVHIVDQTSPQAWLDKTFVVETYGNASAQHPYMGLATVAANVTQIGGVAQSATDLKDFADTGYDPSTHKVVGVVLTDTATAVTNDVNLTDATEAQIDAIETDTNELQGLISSGKLPAQVKGIDDIDLSATMKASVNAEVDTALNTAIPGSPTADSINERVATMDGAYTATRAGYLDNINNAQLLNLSADILGRIDAAISTRAAASTALSNVTWTDAKAGYLTGSVALEATLTAMKGAGWTTETLKAIYDSIAGGGTDPGVLAEAVWEYATRSLTDKAGFTISGTKTTLDALNDITAAAVWAVATRALTDKAGFSLAADQSAVTVGTVTTLTTWDKTGYALSAAGIDSIWDEVMEAASPTARQAMRLFLSALVGKVSGVGTGTEVFRDYGDTKDRLTYSLDGSNNRTAVTRDAT